MLYAPASCLPSLSYRLHTEVHEVQLILSVSAQLICMWIDNLCNQQRPRYTECFSSQKAPVVLFPTVCAFIKCGGSSSLIFDTHTLVLICSWITWMGPLEDMVFGFSPFCYLNCLWGFIHVALSRFRFFLLWCFVVSSVCLDLEFVYLFSWWVLGLFW